MKEKTGSSQITISDRRSASSADVDVRDAGVEGDELEFPDLVGDALRHLGAAMADLAGAEMAAGVEQAVAVLVEDIGALAADDHLRVAVGILALEGGEVGKEMADAALRPLTGGSAGPGRRRLRGHRRVPVLKNAGREWVRTA